MGQWSGNEWHDGTNRLVPRLIHTCSSPNLSKAAMGSEPGERMKMRGAQQWLSPNAFPRLKGGASMNWRPRLPDTNSCTMGMTWEAGGWRMCIWLWFVCARVRVVTHLVWSKTAYYQHLLKLSKVLLPLCWERCVVGSLHMSTCTHIIINNITYSLHTKIFEWWFNNN